MSTVNFDPDYSDKVRRQQVYAGQLLVFSPRPSTVALCQFARQMIEESFAPLDPREAQFSLPVEQFVAILAELKPKFTHHPRSKELIRDILDEFGCDVSKTYFDVPKMRSMAHGDYLRSGIAYPLHPHRDTWYASPLCQQNWWLPIYDIDSQNCMTFFPHYWSQGVRNGSSSFNHYEWNLEGRRIAAQQIKEDTRKQPRPEEPIELEPQIRLVCKVGGTLLFSGAQMHATVPNTSGYTRFSIDFRSMDIDDVMAQRGAPNVDSAPQGTTLWELYRASDFSRVPEDIIRLYDPDAPSQGRVFEPELLRVPSCE
jgi:hypothetical protein